MKQEAAQQIARLINSQNQLSVDYRSEDILSCASDYVYKLNGINPQAYLTWIFDTIADHPINRIDELLPWNFSDNRLEEAA